MSFYIWDLSNVLASLSFIYVFDVFVPCCSHVIWHVGFTTGANVLQVCVLSAGLNALPGSVKFPDSAGAFHYEDSGKLLSVTSNRFIHW